MITYSFSVYWKGLTYMYVCLASQLVTEQGQDRYRMFTVVSVLCWCFLELLCQILHEIFIVHLSLLWFSKFHY
jgi:hypothetical protein